MRTVAPESTRAVTVAGTGGLFVASLGSRTAMRTLACARLAVRPGHLIGGGEVARLVRGEVAQHVAGGEQQAGIPAQGRGQLRIEGEVLTVGLHVVVQHRDVDGVPDPHRHRVVGRDRRLQSSRDAAVSMTVTTPSASARPLLIR